MEKFIHSVTLDKDLCKGCINCIKRCPTEAIRVWDGKAHILEKFCIDCGECVRTCSYHAKRIRRDNLGILERYDYTVALPPPSFYTQFNNLQDVNILLTALLYLGFDDVYEVADAAEQVSEATKRYIADHPENWPLISTACPTVVRLVRIRFPNLLEHLLPLNPPVEVAARLARQRAMELLELVGLLEKANAYPAQLSGGQKRRVAIAGVIAMEPKVLILDEPTAGLDPAGAASILANIDAYRQANQATIIIVSHSMEDVARLTDRLAVVSHGTLPYVGTPREVFSHGEALEAMGLAVPTMNRVFSRLRAMGAEVDPAVYTVEQAKAAFLAALKKKEGK